MRRHGGCHGDVSIVPLFFLRPEGDRVGKGLGFGHNLPELVHQRCANDRVNDNNPQPTHQSYSLESLFQSFLSLPLSENRLQPADELRSKPLRLHMDVLWHAVRALCTEVCTNTPQ